MKSLNFILFTILLLALASTGNSQSLYIDKGQDATGIAIEDQVSDGDNLFVASMSMSGKGIVDFGFFYGRHSDGYALGTMMEYFLVKQSNEAPVSLSFHSSFYMISVKNYGYFSSSSSNKTFYSLGTSIYRGFNMSEITTFYASVFGTYQNSFEGSKNNEMIGGIGLTLASKVSSRNRLLFNISAGGSSDIFTASVGVGFIFLR